MAKSGKVTVYTSYEDDNGVEIEIEVVCRVTLGTEAYFSKSFGNYLPGDPDEVEFLSAVDEAGNDWLAPIEHNQKWSDQVEEKALEEFLDQLKAQKDGDI